MCFNTIIKNSIKYFLIRFFMLCDYFNFASTSFTKINCVFVQFWFFMDKVKAAVEAALK